MIELRLDYATKEYVEYILEEEDCYKNKDIKIIDDPYGRNFFYLIIEKQTNKRGIGLADIFLHNKEWLF